MGLLCWNLRYFPYYSYCRNPTAQEFFVPAGTLIAVKLLTTELLWSFMIMNDHYFTSFFGDW